MTILVAGVFIVMVAIGVFTDADVPAALDDYAVLIVSFAIMAAGFEVGASIRAATTRARKEDAPDG